MTRYIWDADAKAMVEVKNQPRPPSRFPQIMRDTPGVKSPIDAKWVEGRAARREHMKRHNVREVDPSEKPSRPVEPAWVKDWRADRGIERSKPE